MQNNNYEFRELGQEESFDPGSIAQNVPFTQAGFYGDWQKFFKRTVKRYVISKDDKDIAYIQLIRYPLILGKNYLYAPYGPITKDSSPEFLSALKKNLSEIARSLDAIFVRLDFTPTVEKETLTRFFKPAGYHTYHSAYFQPRVEWFLGLNKSEDELYEAMHKDTRYSIRLSDRKEINTEIVTENFTKYFESFYELMDITSRRNGFSLHPREYYRAVFENLDKDNAFLSIARFGHKILAIDLIVIFDKVANYVFACSSNEERNRAPSYGALWKAILHSKTMNCDYFNFGGISTAESPNKNWESLTSFKKKFGGLEVRHSDFFDIVVNKPIYRLYNLRKLLKSFGI